MGLGAAQTSPGGGEPRLECSSWRSPDRARRPRWPCPPRPQHPQTHLGCWCSCSCATGSSARSSLGHRGNRQDVAAEPVRTVCFTSELAQDLRAVLISSCSDKQVILPWGTQKHPESVFFYAEEFPRRPVGKLSLSLWPLSWDALGPPRALSTGGFSRCRPGGGSWGQALGRPR